jgi:hypothetical protein
LKGKLTIKFKGHEKLKRFELRRLDFKATPMLGSFVFYAYLYLVLYHRFGNYKGFER